MTLSFLFPKPKGGPDASAGAEETFDVPPDQRVRSSKGKGWHGVALAGILHPLDDCVLPTIARHVLVIYLESWQIDQLFGPGNTVVCRPNMCCVLPISMARVKGMLALRHARVCIISQLAEHVRNRRPARSLLVDNLGADGLFERERAEKFVGDAVSPGIGRTESSAQLAGEVERPGSAGAGSGMTRAHSRGVRGQRTAWSR